MSAHLPVLIVAVPLLGAVLVPVVGLVSGRAARGVSLAALLCSHLAALAALRAVLRDGVWRYELGGWSAPWGIEYVVDALGGGMAVLVSFMALLTAVYAGSALARRGAHGAAVEQSLHLLLSAGLLGMVLTGDAFNLYVFLEISALAAYGLVARGGERAIVAAFRYLLVGTIAASFYLLGVGYLYAATGTLSLADLAARLPGAEPGLVATATALIVVGLAIKVALFPLHGWLPDVYACAPTPVASFVSAVMGKVGVYALARYLFFVLPDTGASDGALALLGPVAAAAAVAGSALALAQRDLGRMLAYSSVGQMGYVVLGLALANAAGLTGALLHMVNHAVAKACLFMASGNVRERTGAVDVARYAGAARRLPLSMAAFVVAALSLIGLPPFGGFFSKWYLLLGSLERGAWVYVAAIVASSLLTAVYMIRVIELAWFRSPAAPDAPGPGAERVAEAVAPEAPFGALLPALVLAAGVVGLGLFNQTLVEHGLVPALPALER